MARNEFDAWIPEEQGSQVLQRVGQMSAAERYCRREPMGTDAKSVPRSSGVGVSVVEKGGAYGEDVSANDDVVLKARKFGRAIRIAEEDIADSPVAIVETKQRDWATSYAKALDNACFAVTAAENGITVPFTSVYRALSQANAVTGYAAGANIIATAAGAAVSYDNYSDLLGRVEGGDYFDPAGLVVVAHPSFRGGLRTTKDDNGSPIFISTGGGSNDTLFEHPVHWSLGMRTSAVNTDAPAGNPLMMIMNRDFAILGIRSGPESVFIDGRDGASALTDESLLKMRSRRGFVVGHEAAFAIIEKVPAV